MYEWKRHSFITVIETFGMMFVVNFLRCQCNFAVCGKTTAYPKSKVTIKVASDLGSGGCFAGYSDFFCHLQLGQVPFSRTLSEKVTIKEIPIP